MKLQNRFSSLATTVFAVVSMAVLFGCNSKPPADNGGNGGTDPGPGAEVTRGRPDPLVNGPAITGDVIKIGLVASQNGDLRPWGDDNIKGSQLAVDLINAAGGIDGKKVQLLIEDSNSSPEGGKSAAEKLASQGVVGILGEVASGITQLMAQVTYDNGLPHIAVGATKTTITDWGSNVFRVCYTDDFQGPVMAKFAYETLGLRNVAIMTDVKLPYSEYLSKTFKDYFVKLGGNIVTEASYESKSTTFTAQLSNIKSKNPEGIFLSGYFNEVGPIVRQAAQAGLTNVKYFGGDGWDSSQLIESGGDAIVGGFFCNHYNEKEDRKEVQDFLAAWKAKYNGSMPGTTMGALGYDAAALMMDAIKRATTKDGPGIIAAIEATENFRGVSGNITLKGMGGNPAKPALVVEVTKTGFIPRKTFEYSEIYGSN